MRGIVGEIRRTRGGGGGAHCRRGGERIPSPLMYPPSWFAEERLDVLHDFVRRHGFGTLTCADDDCVPQATHLPMLLNPGPGGGKFGALQFHFARPNEQWKLLERG